MKDFLDIINYNLQLHQLPDLTMDDSLTSYYHIYLFLKNHTQLVKPRATFTHTPLTIVEYDRLLHSFYSHVEERYDIQKTDLEHFFDYTTHSSDELLFTPGITALVYALYNKQEARKIEWIREDNDEYFLLTLFKHSIDDALLYDHHYDLIQPTLMYIKEHPDVLTHNHVGFYLRGYQKFLPLDFLREHLDLLRHIFSTVDNVTYDFLNEDPKKLAVTSLMPPNAICYLSLYSFPNADNLMRHIYTVARQIPAYYKTIFSHDEIYNAFSSIPLYALQHALSINEPFFTELLNIQPEEKMLFDFDSDMTLSNLRTHTPSQNETQLML